MAELNVSGSNNPYATLSYSPAANEKNTLSIESYFKLLAAQLANQDMTEPMSNAEMMQQMTQMAMVQSVEAMTESIKTSSAVTTQTYAAGMVGQEITVAVVDKNGKPTGVKYGKVESVNLSGGNPVIRLEGDKTDYPLSHIMGIGKLEDPFAEKPKDPDASEGAGSGDGEGKKPEGAEDPKKPEAGENAGEKMRRLQSEDELQRQLLQQRFGGIFA